MKKVSKNVLRGTIDLPHSVYHGTINNVYDYIDVLAKYYNGFNVDQLYNKEVYKLTIIVLQTFGKTEITEALSLDERFETLVNIPQEKLLDNGFGYYVPVSEIVDNSYIQDDTGYLVKVERLGKLSYLTDFDLQKIESLPVYHSFLPMKTYMEEEHYHEVLKLAEKINVVEQQVTTEEVTEEKVTEDSVVEDAESVKEETLDTNTTKENDNMFTNRVVNKETMFDKMGTKIRGTVGISMLDGSLAFKLKDAWVSRNQMGQLVDVSGMVKELETLESVVMPAAPQNIMVGDVILGDNELTMVTNVDYQQGSLEVQNGSGKIEKIMPVVNQMMGGAVVMKVFNPMMTGMQNGMGVMNPMLMASLAGGNSGEGVMQALGMMGIMNMMQNNIMNPMQQPMNQPMQQPMQQQAFYNSTQQPMQQYPMQQYPMQQSQQAQTQNQQPQQQMQQQTRQQSQTQSIPVSSPLAQFSYSQTQPLTQEFSVMQPQQALQSNGNNEGK